MITVRFPSGFSVQYNSMNAQKWGTNGQQMLFESAAKRDTGEGWSVLVPANCIVEFVHPCRTYQAAPTNTLEVEAEIRGLRKEVAALKRAISKLNKG